MPKSTRQPEAADFNFISVQDSDSFASRIQEHWSRKQEDLGILPPSPAYSVMFDPLQAADLDFLKREKRCLTRNIDRGPFTDGETLLPGATAERKELARKRSHYYDGAFALRECNSSARERIHKESIVMVEVQTNVMVTDEYTFITDLSHNLSSRYQRSESSILVTLSHSACLLLGASFDPAYAMTITALPSQIQPVTNKRNSVLLAKLLEESLGVPPSRGIIKFVGVNEENFAINGKTAAAEIEDLEREQADDNMTTKGNLLRSEQKQTAKQRSKRSMRNLKVDINGANNAINAYGPSSPNIERSGRLTPPQSERDPSPRTSVIPEPLPDRFNMTPAIPMPTLPTKKTALDRKAEKVQRIGHRKSFVSGLFGKQNG